jgi:hypothetical protein
MTHPLVLGLFETPADAATAARALRDLGLPRERVSIVARNHDEEGELATATGGSPGSEIEDSRIASRLAELGAHLIAAIAVVLPGIGPIVADGPLAAGLGEAAGHLAGGLRRTLEDAGVTAVDAEQWEAQIERGAVLIAAHVSDATIGAARTALETAGASKVTEGTWRE